MVNIIDDSSPFIRKKYIAFPEALLRREICAYIFMFRTLSHGHHFLKDFVGTVPYLSTSVLKATSTFCY